MEIFTEEEISNKIIINDIPRKWSSIKHLHSFQINYSNSIWFLKYGYLLHTEVIKQGYSYKYNYNISLLNLLTGKLEFTIPNIFKDNTQLLNLSDTKIVSYSNDNSIQIWSINGKDLKNEFTFKAEHANVLLMINIDKNRFAIVDGKVIKI